MSSKKTFFMQCLRKNCGTRKQQKGKKWGRQSGQMAIFVALIFQVLFVFFAITIHVGLVVHDKINLQNSVDIAAYYGAQKQAEVLALIAHSNYQIRQAWKLLSWRLRGLGDGGRNGHPFFSSNPVVGEEVPFGRPDNTGDIPSVCWMHNAWREGFFNAGTNSSGGEQLCYKARQIIPKVPEIKNLFPTLLPWNKIFSTISSQQRQQFGESCRRYGYSNYLLGAIWLTQYQIQMRIKQRNIESLSALLAQDQDGRGDSIREGVESTLRNNFTRSNRKDYTMEVFNSLQGQSFQNLFPEIRVQPYVYYTDMWEGAGGNCRIEPKMLNNPAEEHQPVHSGGEEIDALIESLKPFLYAPVIVGVEKNPWLMTYYAVRASTRIRPPFSPFSEPITVTAKAYAKPFGGRVGPWAYKLWPYGSPYSIGTYNDLLDKLLPPLRDRGTGDLDELPDKNHLVPNYSRFPGDTLGLRSQRALSIWSAGIQPIAQEKGFSHKFYDIVDASPTSSDVDILAWDHVQQTAPPLRQIELSVIAPDLFDITHYSIEPEFFENYQLAHQQRFVSSDLGSRPDDAISVRKQIPQADSIHLSLDKAPWMIKDWKHLLTGWMPSAHRRFFWKM